MLRAFVLLLALPIAFTAAAQKKPLTLEAIYHPTAQVPLSGAIQDDFEWIDETTFVWPREDTRGEFVEWRAFDAVTGASRVLPVQDEDAAFNRKRTAAVIVEEDELWLVDWSSGTAKKSRLTNAAGKEEEATFSPDGKQVAFLRANDLYVVSLDGRERRLTADGSAELLNGKLDYVYQEEIYGRGVWKGFWWSPDSKRIAFLQLNERGVPTHTIVDDIPIHVGVNTFHYPKAGDPNPRVKLLVVPAAASASGGTLTTVDDRDGEFLIVNVAWHGEQLTYQLQNREQTWLELRSGNRTLLRETTKAWVEPFGAPFRLADGTFLWQSERSGWRHLYHYRADGSLIRQVTRGEWEVRDVHGSDGQYLYFSGTERSAIGVDVYRIRLDGSGLQRLSDRLGTHTAKFSPTARFYVDKWSDLRTPDQVRVHRSDGSVAHVVDENRTPLAEYDLPHPELLQIRTRDGFPMEAILIRPTNFDPSKKYPIYQFTYAGPHAPRVRNSWDGQRALFQRLIAQQGALVFIPDNRSASGKGAVTAWLAHKEVGAGELRDLEDALAWLKAQPYVDGSRALIDGWSNGGFMVLYALTHSKSWSAGIAGAPVADWRDYDTVFTERILLTPQNNPEGYRKSSPLYDADKLHGNLLLIHGTTDDNVHPQNTLQFAYALQQQGRLFEMMMLPRTRHRVTQKNMLYFVNRKVLDFVTRQLLDGRAFAH